MLLLDALKAHSAVVATTADAGVIAQLAPRDASIGDAAVLHELRQGALAPRLSQALAAHAGEPPADLADALRVQLGCAVLESLPGCIGTDVDARLAFDTAGSVARARRLVHLYEKAGIDRARVRLRIVATWEGIQAARALAREGIGCEATLVLGLCQAVLCGDAGVARIACPVGRIGDWQRMAPQRAAAAAAASPGAADAGCPAAALAEPIDPAAGDPGVQTLTRLWRYLRHYGFATEVVGAELRDAAQALALAGCERLAIDAALLALLHAAAGEVPRRLVRGDAEAATMHASTFNEASFRWSLNEDAMATELLAAGIREFAAAAAALDRAIAARRGG
ncbi:MAG: transaldolase [Burkholderiales bacterium]|nr:transaldolase [Burkholderiales bacterium]